jgi:hypothetical protein
MSSSKPQMTDEEIAHANQMSADMGPEQDDTENWKSKGRHRPYL